MFYFNLLCLVDVIWECRWNDDTHALFKTALNVRDDWWEALRAV